MNLLMEMNLQILLNLKYNEVKNLTREKFLLTKENFSEVTEQIHDKLSKTKATHKEVLRADLLLEETFMRMTETGGANEIKVSIRQRFGDLSLILEITRGGDTIRLLKSLIMMKMMKTITAR